jgi:regulator of replication initiation timing
MKDTKSLLLLLVSLLLVLVSFVLIWTWGYSYYSKNGNEKTNTVRPQAQSEAIANTLRDSLQKVYDATLQDLDVQLNTTLTHTDSLQNELDAKLAEFYRLRTEITAILKNRTVNNNFAVAKQKIGELQTKVDGLKEKNQVVDSENRKLNAVLNEMSNAEKASDKQVNMVTSVKNGNTDEENPVLSAFIASDLRLAAVINADESENTVVDKADKINGAFTVMNLNSQLTSAEMMVVVIKPDGKVLKGSGWDSGTFNTPEGKKIYSYKFSFAYSRGEAKRLAFSLGGGNFTKGSYTMQVYHNGLMIGKLVKTLS